MKHLVSIGAATLALVAVTAGAADAQARYRRPAPHPTYSTAPYGPGGSCPVNYHDNGTGEGCVCNEVVPFYTGGSYPGGNGTPPYGGGGYPPGGGYGGGGYDIHLRVPGVRVSGIPVNVPSGNVYVQGAPIYVQAPPVRVASPQIYLQRPQVYVQPSQVTVEPPTVHVAGCATGQTCEAVGTSSGYSGQD